MTQISEAVECLEELGYTVIAPSKPEPKEELPTEPGAYFCADGTQDGLGDWHTDHYQFHYLNTLGNWVDIGWGAPSVSNLPLTKLEPVPVTAKKVIDALRQRIGSIDSAYDFQWVAGSFGVTE